MAMHTKFVRRQKLQKQAAVIGRSRTRTADPADPARSSEISSKKKSGVPVRLPLPPSASATSRQQLTCSRTRLPPGRIPSVAASLGFMHNAIHSACPSEPDEDCSAQDWEEFDLDIMVAGKGTEEEAAEGRALAPKASALQYRCIIASAPITPVILLPSDDDDDDDAETIPSVVASTLSAHAQCLPDSLDHLERLSSLSGRPVSSVDDLEECQEWEELGHLRPYTAASHHSTPPLSHDRLPAPPPCPLRSQHLAHVEAGGKEVKVGLV